jgi:hypothetical protein
LARATASTIQRRFRLNHAIIDGAGPLSSVLGPADWTHGIARPFQNVVADPNPNLTVQLFRKPGGVDRDSRRNPVAGPLPASEPETILMAQGPEVASKPTPAQA